MRNGINVIKCFIIKSFIAYISVILMPICSSAQTSWIDNRSYTTDCAEHDNIDIPVYGPVGSIVEITATHPPFYFTDEDCPTDFTGDDCAAICPGSNYIFTPDTIKIFDDHVHAILVYTLNEFWRPNRMKVMFRNGAEAYGNYFTIVKKIDNRNEWPQFFVLYSDSYLRLIPQPPQGLSKTCLGSSVIVGPAEGIQASTCTRPYSDIDSVLIDTVGTQSVDLNIWYHDGSTAVLNASVDTQKAVVKVTTNFPQDRPLVTLRSMWINSSNCDADSISCEGGKYPLLSGWSMLYGSWFKIFRSQQSVHNNSAPDIEIEVIGTNSVSSYNSDAPLVYDLHQNYPNPFNPVTVIQYRLEVRGHVRLSIYDLLGNLICVPVNENQESGTREIKFNASALPSGIYYYRLMAGSRFFTRKMVLLK